VLGKPDHLYDKLTCLVDVERAVDIVYLDFSKAFDYSLPQPCPRETDASWSRQVVYVVGGELTDRSHPEDGGK